MSRRRKNSREIGPRAALRVYQGVYPCAFQMEGRTNPCDRCGYLRGEGACGFFTTQQTRRLARLMAPTSTDGRSTDGA